MTKKEFVSKAVQRGYCTAPQAHDYCSRHPKTDYSEDDLEQMATFADRQDWAGIMKHIPPYMKSEVEEW